MLYNPLTKSLNITNYELLTGVTALTWRTLLQDANIEILLVVVEQDNTTPQANNVDFRLTIDGIIMTGLNITLNDAQMYGLYLNCWGATPAMGERPTIGAAINTAMGFGFQVSDVAGAFQHSPRPIGGKAVQLEYSMDTVGANQEFRADITYSKLE